MTTTNEDKPLTTVEVAEVAEYDWRGDVPWWTPDHERVRLEIMHAAEEAE